MDLSTSRLDPFLVPGVTPKQSLPPSEGGNHLAESVINTFVARSSTPIFQVIWRTLRTLDQAIFSLQFGEAHLA